MRRSVLSILGACLLVIVGIHPTVFAQDASTPAGAELADLGLPALDVTLTTAGYEGIPESLDAGRYLVTLTVAEEVGEYGGSIEFVQPVGVTVEEFLATLAPPPGEGEGAAPVEATPPLAPDASPPAEEGAPMEGPPAFFFESLYVGGVSAIPAQPGQIVLDLTPGEWIASSGGDPDQAQEPVSFDVTGEMPAELVEPEAGATITMGEYLIEVTEGELVSGSQMLRIDNDGAQPHFIVWFQGPEGLTEGDMAAVLESDMTGTPAAVDFDPNKDLIPTLFTGTQSTGTSVWFPVDLEPGTYGLVCFFPDIADGMPHAFKEMYSIVEVSE